MDHHLPREKRSSVVRYFLEMQGRRRSIRPTFDSDGGECGGLPPGGGEAQDHDAKESSEQHT